MAGMLESPKPGGFGPAPEESEFLHHRPRPPPAAPSAWKRLGRMSWASSLVPACARDLALTGSRCADVIRLLQPGHHRTDAVVDVRGSHIQRRRCNGDCCSQHVLWAMAPPLNSTSPLSLAPGGGLKVGERARSTPAASSRLPLTSVPPAWDVHHRGLRLSAPAGMPCPSMPLLIHIELGTAETKHKDPFPVSAETACSMLTLTLKTCMLQPPPSYRCP
ncbi:hypothetical protein K491DRAFT_152489 [Lophiostoma macrostomum CBS 122681]|uniref:Uncharacterized protein n=1 Tax=Lophiostoma macrostomum CBS 122681 TaxID=1314788 RepID=A0A6A6TK60_9PLEO|nr:hypothetical protein K491DRAFT_152489 [Lophiostoma macrostomum CBS 122681]